MFNEICQKLGEHGYIYIFEIKLKQQMYSF